MMRVLVVDDSEVARLMLSGLIESFNHRVVAEAATLAQAVSAYRAHKPDLVTLDVSLEGETGIDVLKALRQEDAQAKVLMVSGNSQQKIYDELMKAGACAFLSKPVQLDELEATLKRIGGG